MQLYGNRSKSQNEDFSILKKDCLFSKAKKQDFKFAGYSESKFKFCWNFEAEDHVLEILRYHWACLISPVIFALIHVVCHTLKQDWVDLGVHQTAVWAFYHPCLVTSQVSPSVVKVLSLTFLAFLCRLSDIHMGRRLVFFSSSYPAASGTVSSAEILHSREGIFPWNSCLNTWVRVCCFRGARCSDWLRDCQIIMFCWSSVHSWVCGE